MRKKNAWKGKKETTSLTKQSVESPVILSNAGSKEMDKTIASFFYEN